LDTILHADRLERRGANQRKRTYWEELGALPDGVFIRETDKAWASTGQRSTQLG
jgi:hypothetical protein